jgi:hypothetical protein
MEPVRVARRRQGRVVTLLVIGAIVAGGGFLEWRASRSGSSGSDWSPAFAAPDIGRAAGGFTLSGLPFVVVRHSDGSFTAVKAVSPHVTWGSIKKLLGWCPSSRTFDDAFHGSKFDEYGRYLAGPAPTGLTLLTVETIPGTSPGALHIKVGLPRTSPRPRDTRGQPGPGPGCAGETIAGAGLLLPAAVPSGLTPAGLVALAPLGRWSVHAVLVITTGLEPRLCADALPDGGCRGGVPVVEMAQSLNPGNATLIVPGDWVVLVRNGALADPIRAA